MKDFLTGCTNLQLRLTPTLLYNAFTAFAANWNISDSAEVAKAFAVEKAYWLPVRSTGLTLTDQPSN
jgi:hypothetical protein